MIVSHSIFISSNKILKIQKIMTKITLKGNSINTIGDLPAVGSKAPNFILVKSDLSRASLGDFAGSKLILNIFPSIDTGPCATSVRKFNQEAASLENTKVLCISRDLPFAQNRFCGAEGIENVVMLSDFVDGSFGKAYNLTFADGPLAGLDSRCIVVLNENQEVVYTEQVSETIEEPDYAAALAAI
jgi:thioredoxin-dependent peroxiredoxin